MPVIYIPSISYTFEQDSKNYFNLMVDTEKITEKYTLNSVRLPPYEIKTKYKLNWWSTESIFNYPHIMLTAYYETQADKKNRTILNSRERLGIKDNSYFKIMGDSGGFQVISKKAQLDPLKVLEWQDNECYWGFTLDIPPLKKIADAHTSHFTYKFLPPDEFMGCLRKTADNSMIMLKNRKSNLKLLYALQGFSVGHFEYTKKYLAKNNCSIADFDGIGIGIKKSNKRDALVYNLLSVLYSLPDIKQMHIFGVSGIDSLAIAIYCLRKYLRKGLVLTYDSSTPIFIAKFLQYFMVMEEKIRIRFGEQVCDKIDFLPCNCPVCTLMGGNTKYLKSSTWQQIGEDKNIGYTLMSLHNLHHMIGMTEMFNSLVQDDEKIKQLIGILCKDSVQIINAIDEILEYGLNDPGRITKRALSQYYTKTEVKKL